MANQLGIIFFPAYDWAIHPSHPEREERLLYTQDQLREEGLFDFSNIHEFKPEIIEYKDILRTHFCIPNLASVTTESHLISAGGAVKAAQLCLENKVDKAFAMVRPPGHHAMKVIHGNRGFCNINNEAIMVDYIRHAYGKKKIAIIDTDCHHGDGTQDIFWHDPDVLFISLHQDGRTIFPGTGFIHEIGGPNALGKTINIPLPPNTADEGYLQAIEQIVMPILDHFEPDIIINSAGQDNHFSDPITMMNLSALGYAQMVELINPDIAVLEGGYAIKGALPYTNLGICLALAGMNYNGVKEPNYNPDKYKQDVRIEPYIRRLSEHIIRSYFHPPVAKRGPVGEIARRKKAIYYDTDGIKETQIESVRICDDCAGCLQIETASTQNTKTICIELPFHCCDTCRDTAQEWIAEAEKEENVPVQIIDKSGVLA